MQHYELKATFPIFPYSVLNITHAKTARKSFLNEDLMPLGAFRDLDGFLWVGCCPGCGLDGFLFLLLPEIIRN